MSRRARVRKGSDFFQRPEFRRLDLEQVEQLARSAVSSYRRYLPALALSLGFAALWYASMPEAENPRLGLAPHGLRDIVSNLTPQTGVLAQEIPIWQLLLLFGFIWGVYRRYVKLRPGPQEAPTQVPAVTDGSAAAAASDAELTSAPGTELPEVMRSCKRALFGVAAFSGFSNLLTLAGSLFMLEVYDRVLPSRSVPTLIGLSILLVLLYAAQGALDTVRARILARIGAVLDARVGPRVFDLTVRLPILNGDTSSGLQPLRDLDNIRAFISGAGPIAFFDMPWMPLYLFVIFMFHPVLGIAATLGAALLVALTMWTSRASVTPTQSATAASARRFNLAEMSRSNAEALVAMGMLGRLRTRFEAANGQHNAAQLALADVTTGMGSVSKILRMLLQSAMLALGAFLVIEQQATGGIIIAGSILVGRALAPIDLAISQWKTFVTARQSWGRLTARLAQLPADPEPMPLPEPKVRLAAEGVSVVAPGKTQVLVQDVSFVLEAGQGLGIIGPSGSGKSTLSRALVGAWRPAKGRIRLDNADLVQWPTDALGRHIGYLPQDVALYSGSVADNISRFHPNPDPPTVVAAARAAGVHDMILGLRDGYGTDVGEHGASLSGGQRQRIGLARALYGEPFLVVLDEPNSNLDAEGETALAGAIDSVRKRGGILIIVAHRPSALAGVSHVLVLNQGRVQAFGAKDNVLSALFPRPQAVDAGRAGAARLEKPAAIVADAGRRLNA